MSLLISLTFPSHMKSYNPSLFHQNKPTNKQNYTKTLFKLVEVFMAKEYPTMTEDIYLSIVCFQIF